MHSLKVDKSIGYVYFIDKNHPCSNSQGKVYLHRHVWFNNTGEIPEGFHIHHKDGNKLNNKFSNLEKLTPSDHAYKHNPIQSLSKIACKTCGKKFIQTGGKKRTYCSPECFRLALRKSKRPPVKQLLQEVEYYGYCEVGRMYGVSDNAIRKWINGSVV